jgi:two-component system, LuxR family, response regulator FixJ
LPIDPPLPQNRPELSDRPTVHVVEDDPAIAGFLTELLGGAGFDVEAFSSAEAFLEGYEPRSPQCLLVDLRLPDLDGLGLQARLHQRRMRLPVILMTGFATTSVAVQSMKLGALDFLEKPLRGDVVLGAVRAALDHDRRAARRSAELSELEQRFGRLTPREREVLEHVVAGLSSRDIAGRLGLSKKTVDLHRSHFMSKLGARSLVELVKMTVRLRELSDDAQGLPPRPRIAG